MEQKVGIRVDLLELGHPTSLALGEMPAALLRIPSILLHGLQCASVQEARLS